MFVQRSDNGMASKFYVKSDAAFLKNSKNFLYVKNFVKKWMHWRNIVVAVPVAATIVVFSMAAFQKTIVVYPVSSTSSANSSSRDKTFLPLANKTPDSASSVSAPSVNPKVYSIQPVQKIVVVHTTVIPASTPTADTTVTTVATSTATATATATVTKIVYENNNPTLSATATNTSSTEKPTGLNTAGSAPTATPTYPVSGGKTTAVNSSIKNTSASQSMQSESSATSSASQNSVLSIK